MQDLNQILERLEEKYGQTNDVMKKVDIQNVAANCSGSHCEYAIGDVDCSGCKGAMFG